MDFFTFFVLVSLVALLIYARKIEKRRRKDVQKYNATAAALTARIHVLEQQAQIALTTGEPAHPKPAAPLVPAVPPKPAPSVASAAAHAPNTTSVPAIAPPVASPPKVALTSPAPAKEVPHPPFAAAATVSAAPAMPSIAAPIHPPVTATPQASAVSHAVPPLTPGMVKPLQTSQPPGTQERVPFSSGAYAQKQPVKKEKRSVSLEESLGTNWFPKVGITLVVLGVAFLMRTFWGNMSSGGRAAILYTAALGTLAGGIFLERKERYRRVGRALIGGGWAITFVLTYAINHVQAVRVLPSEIGDLLLMLAVAGMMVWHTLRYNSQTVTGLAFLLGFASVTLNPDPPYNLIAAAILASALTVIVLRRQWFELEVFGILASYLNHFYWLYTILNPKPDRGPFPEYWNSVTLMLLYWVIFRASYLLRKISNKEQESISTLAGLLNPLLFLAVMKYQSFHPEWAFYALLTMGAVEFTLGQLPVSRRRKTPFQILSSLGATLMVVAVPFKYAGSHSLELLWMAGAEAFLLAGIFARERLFRQFSGIISLLVAAYLFGWPPHGVVYHAARIINAQPHHDSTLGLVLAVVAALFHVNSHVLARIWEQLFDREGEQQALSVLSFTASLFAAAAIYASVADHGVAVVLAILATVLAWTGRQFGVSDLIYQAHWIAVVAIIDVSVNAIHLDAAWHSIPERFITFGLVAGLTYLSSNFVRLDVSRNVQSSYEIPVVLYRWAGTGLIALAMWMQVWFAPVQRDWLIAMLWTALALALSAMAQLIRRNEFKWQAFTLAMMSFCLALVVNFDFANQFHHLSYRLISVTVVACGIYLLARWAPIRQIRPAYSWAGTILLGYLIYRETREHQELWTAVLWVSLAALLGLAARLWKDRALLWQTHLLAAAATAWTIATAFLGKTAYQGTHPQLITVLITSALLYGLTWVTKIAGVIESDRIWQAYSWAGSLLLSWLAWYQLQPINVSLAWGVFALILFELGYKTSSSYLRAQAYVALTCSFAHLFYSNFNTPLAVSTFDPRIFLIVLLVPIYFWVYWRLHEKTDTISGTEMKLKIEYLLACVGTATVAALARFELPAEAVVAGYAVIVLALLATAWLAKLPVFLYQALIMLGVTVFRISMHNFHNLRSSFVSALPGSLWAIGLLAAGIPIAFQLRSKDEKSSTAASWMTFLVQRPELPLFFAAVLLLAVLLAIKLPDMITLAWSIEGIIVYILALMAKERSFRLTGFALVGICVAKILCWDLWRISDQTIRYSTLIGVGIFVLLISYLYARYKEALRAYL